MTYLDRERRLTLNELAGQERVALSTVWRWALRGVRNVQLETFTVGGRRFTTVEAFERFIAATTAASAGTQAPAVPHAVASSAVDRALGELANNGV